MLSAFREKDVRRCYDLLQHDPDQGLTQLKAEYAGQVIGVGLFDNEEDFVAECLRYNTLGELYVGVNPRSLELLDQFAGLQNRIRSVFADVTSSDDVASITGVVVPDTTPLSDHAKSFASDATVMHDRERYFALGTPIDVGASDRVRAWFSRIPWAYEVGQHVRVTGTSLSGGGLLNRRVSYRRYRPYRLSEISDALLVATDG
ncbi:MAG: hypothetical protein CME19_22575 [Gemmatimonadetes bacterium]|nr:hypothetical protein [Gemmatimonadota bacterium]